MLSKRTQELLDMIVPSKKAPAVGKGTKLVIGDGAARLEADTIAFVKSLTAPAKSELVKSHLGGRRVATIAKRAAMTAITADEMQGGTPRVAPTGKPRSEPGLSDEDIKVLEQEITTGWPALAPAQATKLFLESYAVISAHGGRRISAGE